MSSHFVTQDEVLGRSTTLPGFPAIITKILATLEDPEANLSALVDHIGHDPVIAARVLSLASLATGHQSRMSPVRSLFTATSLIGINRVREVTIFSSVAHFVGQYSPAKISAAFWQHSVSVGVCCEELALHTTSPASPVIALIAGLLHDIGQLWLYRFNQANFRAAWNRALVDGVPIETAERERFGIDHSIIGAWLADHWSLPAGIYDAIRHHHQPDSALDEPLVPIVHIAEVLSNALELAGREENRVVTISSAACRKLDLVWDETAQPLFGRMEARSRHANALFQDTATL